jgi:hypothetical protein
MFMEAVEECLSMALMPDYDDSDSQEFRTHFKEQFLNRNKAPLNDQELTNCMKKCINRYYKFQIQYCKVFSNPKIQKYPLYRDNKEVYNTRHTVVVYYSIPKGYWEEYDI